MRILVTGCNGQVGYELRRTLAPLGEVIAPERQQLDLASPESIRDCIKTIKPDLIVNAAAYTAVDKAEQERDLAMAINATAPQVMAEEAERLGAALIHYSTDYVFDGSKDQPYLEDDAACPINVYGESKWAGEEAIRAVAGRHLILRTSWVYGMRGNNFLLSILRLARQREELGIVDDQIGSPTWSRMIAETTACIVAQQAAAGSFSLFEGCSGTYHLTSSGQTSWYGFAKQLLAGDPNKSEQLLKQLKPITTADYPTAAARPAYSVLATKKLQRQFNLLLPDWSDSLALAMA